MERVEIIEQPTHFTRWWMRHYAHIALASMAGSAILVCIITIILLPIAINYTDDDSKNCVNTEFSTVVPTSTNESIAITTGSFWSINSSTDTIPVDRLCATNAMWKIRATTVAGSLIGLNSSASTQLKNPTDLIVDINGNLVIADSGNHRIIYWAVNSTEGHIIAGTGYSSSWSNAFKNPTSIAVWKNQLYVSDLNNYRILAFSWNKTEISSNGNTIIGQYGSGSNLNQINKVTTIIVDGNRDLLYLSDSENNRILKLNLIDNTIQLAIDSNGSHFDNISLNKPSGMTINIRTGTLYIVDSHNHRVQKFILNSRRSVTVAGGMNFGRNLSQLYFPSGVAIDNDDNIYVADSANHRIVQWLAGAQEGRIIAGMGIAGIGDSQLDSPVQIKFDVHFNLYVVDKNNNRIQRFDLLSNGC